MSAALWLLTGLGQWEQRILGSEREDSSEFLFSLPLSSFARVLDGTVLLYNHSSHWVAVLLDSSHWVLVTRLPLLAPLGLVMIMTSGC